jgi:hypothetical protein
MNVRTRGFNQNGVVIVSFTRTLLVYRHAVARFVLGEAPPGRPFQHGDIGQATKRGEPQAMAH